MAMTRSTETREATLTRLLDKARAEGVRLYRDPADGRYYASSASTPGRYYLLTGYSCECADFCQHGRCKHYAALMSALGWIDTDPSPAPAMVVTVAHSGGLYNLPALNDRGGEWQAAVTVIAIDGRDVLRITGEGYAVRVAWLEGGRVVDDMTESTPAGLTHHGAVRYWLEALGGDQDVSGQTRAA